MRTVLYHVQWLVTGLCVGLTIGGTGMFLLSLLGVPL
jgi:hypothetical protein